MSTPANDSLPGVLFVDDEEKARKYFERAFQKEYRVFTAEGGKQGLDLLRDAADEIALVVSDQRMPEMAGVDFLSQVRACYPAKIRILTTAYSDLDSAIRSVNEGRIYQYVTKPWDLQDFQMVLKRAFDYYTILTERDHLMALKMSTLQRIVIADRLKTLAGIARSGCLPQGDLLLRTLSAMIARLPDGLDLNPAAGGAAMLHHGLARFMRQEEAAATQVLQLWESADFDLEATTAALRSAMDAMELSGTVERSEAALRLHVAMGSEDPIPLCRTLYGGLCEAAPSSTALAFMRLLAAAKTAGLAVEVHAIEGSGETPLLHFPAEDDEVAENLEERLAALYDRWDTERLGR